MIYGNKEVRELLSQQKSLAPVTWFRGLEGIGKRQVALEKAQREAKLLDILMWQGELILSDVNTVIRPFLEQRPRVSKFRIAILDMDRASTAVQTSLLKLCEEPSSTAKIVLLSDIELISPLASRAQKYDFAPLSRADIASVLKDGGYTPEEAWKLAGTMNGRLETDKLKQVVSLTGTIKGFVQACKGGDWEVLIKMTQSFTQEHIKELQQQINLITNPELVEVYNLLSTQMHPRTLGMAAALKWPR